jgi:hypothetical protein
MRYTIINAVGVPTVHGYTRSIPQPPAAPAKGQASRALPNSRLLFSKHYKNGKKPFTK